MAKATVKCTCKKCGKIFEMSAVKYNRTEADNWEKWAIENIDECKDCIKAEADAKAAATAKANGWAQLEGSEKQIAWAESIRASLIRYAEEYAEEYAESLNMDVFDKVMETIENKTSAKWFIDNRNESKFDLICKIATEIA